MFDPVGDGAGWSAQERGQALQVILEERLRLRLHTMMPIDRTPAQMRAISADNKLWQDLVRKQKRRAAQRERKAALSNLGDLDVREEDLFAATDEQWRTISDLMRDIGGHAAWRGLTGGSLRRVMNRAAVALVRKNMIKQRNEQGTKGQPVRLIRRKV
jgi:hypothetical protein